MKPTETVADLKEKIKQLCKEYGITNYTIHDDLTIDVIGHVNLSKKLFTELPIKFGKVTGNFDCSQCNSLTSLAGAPTSVIGGFNCGGCSSLTSLAGAPISVGGGFTCYLCISLTSLAGAPTSVGGSFGCSECSSLTSLTGAPTSVNGNFYCSGCSLLTSFEHLPKQINGALKFSSCPKLFNILALFNTKGIKEIEHDINPLENIINKYLKTNDMLGCQDEMIDAGFEEYAEIE